MARILVVDDQVAILKAIETFLMSQGHEVITALDGLQAFRLSVEHEFDLLLTDIAMPNMDGLEAIRAIRQSRPGLPVIIMTGVATEEQVEEARNFGAHSVLRKPFPFETLAQALAAALNISE